MCVEGVQCDTQVANASGGTPPYYFGSDTFRNGAPPFGLVIGTDGYLTGTPKLGSNGTYHFGICVTDSVTTENCSQTSVVIDTKEVNCTTGNTGMNCGSSTTTTVPQNGQWSTWTAHISGVRTQRYTYYCAQGRMNVEYTVTFDAPPGFIAAIRNGTSYGFSTEFDNAVASMVGQETVLAQCEACVNGYNASGGYCGQGDTLQGGTANIPANVTVLMNSTSNGGGGYIGISPNVTPGWYTMNDYFINYFGNEDYECLNGIGVNVTAFSTTQITGKGIMQGCGFGDAYNISVVFNKVS